jgi:ParB-like chromosome segregation protein Spo0J
MTAQHDADVEITSIEVGDRLLKPDTQLINDLAKDLAERGLLQRIGVRARADGKHDLIWGRHRFEAAVKLGWISEERDVHRARLGALLKERQADKPPTGLAVSGKGGRGRRGVKSRVADAEGVTKQAIEKSERRIAKTIGEPIDLERDTPAELRRKADKVRAAPQATARELRNTRRRLERLFGKTAKPKAKPPEAEPARETVPYTVGTFVHRYTAPARGDTKVETAWLRHAPVAEVVDWMLRVLSAERVFEIIDNPDLRQRLFAALTARPNGAENAPTELTENLSP